MGVLTPDAAALIRSGKGALRPDASDRARVLASLERTLGASALLDGTRDMSAPRRGSPARFSSGWAKLLGGFSVLAVAGAGALIAPHLGPTAPARSTDAPLASSPPVAVAASPPVVSHEEETPVLLSRANGTGSGARARARSAAPAASDALTEEVRLLTKAERQLSSGLAGDALKTLGEHEGRFPRGALAEERIATRVEALCALGRFLEAKSDVTRLARAYPNSAHLDGALRFCGDALEGAR